MRASTRVSRCFPGEVGVSLDNLVHGGVVEVSRPHSVNSGPDLTVGRTAIDLVIAL